MSVSIRDEEQKLGNNSSFDDADVDARLRRYAVLRRVWSLNDEELGWINRYVVRQTTAGEFEQFINEDHEWKLRVEINNHLYDVELIELSREWFEDAHNKDEIILVSLRENRKLGLYIALVKRVTGDSSWVKFKQLFIGG